ncbi:TPA: phage tail tape measure protein [Vibrio cholerae]|nr:phage tail tape measure protein [Vibrio cholerae]
MADKISLVLDTTVKGLEDIVSTTSAAERLTAAIAKQRGEVISLNSQLKKVEGYQSAIKRMEKLREQSKQAELSVSELGKQLEENKAQATGLRVAYSQTQAEIKGLNSQLKKASGDGAERLKVQLHQAQNRLESLNLEMHQGKVRTSDLNSAYKKATQRVTELTDKQTKQRDKLRGLGAALKESGINTRRLGDEQQRLEQKAEKATAAMAKQNARMKEMQAIQSRIDGRSAKLGEIGGKMTSLAIAAAPLVGSTWAAVKNESSFADVKKVVNMSPEEAAQMRQWSLATSASKDGGGMSGNEINSMLAAGGRSGIKDLNELKQFVLDSAQMGVAFDMNAQDAGNTLATFKAGLGLDQKGALGLAGMINYLSNDSRMDPKELADVMAREGATAKLAGFTNNDTAALATSMIATGMSSERVATAVKNISGRLTMGDAATGTQKKALASLGFDSASLAASMQDDAAGSLLEVLDAIKSAPLEKQSALISQIFGEEAKGAVAALAGNTKEFIRLRELANKAEEVHLNSLKDEFATRIATSEIGIQVFTNKINRLAVIIGGTLLPSLNSFLEPLGVVVDSIASFAAENEETTKWAVGLSSAAIAVGGAYLSLKAAMLFFGNLKDKGGLFRKGLNRETNESGRAAQFAAKQFSRLNDTLWNSGGGGRRSGRGRGGRGGSAGRRSSSGSRVRSRNPLARAYNFASTAFTAKRGALPLALGGGALAMTPAMAMAQDALDIGGDVAEGLGKGGLNKLIRPLSMAISTANIATALAGGDTKGAITEGGGLLGGLGGASLGAAIGTALLPGVGTVIGGLAGSLLGDFTGSELGSWFADEIKNPPNKLVQTSEVKAQLEEKARKEDEARLMPPIQIGNLIGQINAAPGMNEKQLAELVAQKVSEALSQQFGSMTGLSIYDSLSISAIDR